MSIFVMAPVLRATLPDLVGTPDRPGCTAQTLKLVSLALADSANDDGTGARPGVRTIATFGQIHSATAVRALGYLVDLGATSLTDPGGPGRCATYTVHVGWYFDRIDQPRHRRSCPPLRAPCAQDPRAHGADTERAHGAREGCAPHAREARASDARASRASDARSYVSTSDTSMELTADDNDLSDVPEWALRRFGYLMRPREWQ